MMIWKLLFVSMLLLFGVAKEKKTEALLNKLFAPGPLIEGHKDKEGTGCLECHDAGKGVPDLKCLTCHKEIKKFVLKKKGFHGLQSESCFKCHSDHKGRDYDSTKIDINVFDHDSTGYKLEGEHKGLDCKECHKEKRLKKDLRKSDMRFLGLTSTCKECHKKDDPHKFIGDFAKNDCNKCHGLKKWTTEILFDHNKDTKYLLKGKHKEAKCNDCHVQKNKNGVKRTIYKWPNLKKNQCLSCHSDQHKNKLSTKFRGGNCAKCHSEKRWEIKDFNHRITKFELKGKHKETKCVDCHKQKIKTLKMKDYHWVNLKTKCASCHNDYHSYGKRFSKKLGHLNKCESCHGEESWEKTHRFNHNKDTRYPISGKHLELKCNKCHTVTQTIKRKPVLRKYSWKHLTTKTCENCHKNPHRKKFTKKFLQKKCTECHVSSGWNKKPNFSKNFNHDETRFKLTGKHKKEKCSSCHVINKNQVFQFKSFKKSFCVDCHDNPHLNQFHLKTNEQSCKECHNTQKFSNTQGFDHSVSNFKLRGRHKKLKCTECHTRTRPFKTEAKKKPKVWHKYTFNNLDKDGCKTCHQDYHKGQFNKDCSECHNEKKWRRVKFNHTTDSDFPLIGKHQKVKCNKCHTEDKTKIIKFGKPVKKHYLRQYKLGDPSCYSCHKSDDEHKGQFGTDCSQCHAEQGWKKTKDFHRDYTLHGAHFTAECKECHIDRRKMSGMSDNCVYCHQKDDVHSGSLPDCKSCHVQQFWEHSKFRHSLTFFPLRGSHRTLDCFSCHKQNKYEGLPSNCIDCHQAEWPSVVSPVHSMPTFQNCNECHNQFTWPGAN